MRRCATSARAVRAASSGSDRSPVTVATSRPSLVQASVVARRLDSLRPQRTMSAPAAASASAMAAPIPRAAPVTSAVCPESPKLASIMKGSPCRLDPCRCRPGSPRRWPTRTCTEAVPAPKWTDHGGLMTAWRSATTMLRVLDGSPAQVDDPLVLGQVEVQVGLGPPVVRVAGHGVPDAPGGERRDPDGELARGDALAVDVLADGSLAGGGVLPDFDDVRFVARDEGRGQLAVRRHRHQVVGGLAGHGDGLRSCADVEDVLRLHRVLGAVRGDEPGAGEADDAELASIAERLRAHLVRRHDLERLPGRHGSADQHAVALAQTEAHLSGSEELLHEEAFAKC